MKMQKIWVKVEPWDKKLVTTALEGGADGVMVPPGYSEAVKSLGKIVTISTDGDLKIGTDVIFYEIKSGSDETEIVKLSREKIVVLSCNDWTIIPLENLIAKGAKVVAQVNNLDEARTAFGILEKGVDHILLIPIDAATLRTTLAALRSAEKRIALEEAEIIEIRPAGMGDRVCVDTCTAMKPGQGILVGNSSTALFLVHSESIENPYVSPRPFRVNAGPVHAYTRVPDGKTKYLCELSAGDPVMIIDFTGEASVGTVGRLKIERRPLMLISAGIRNRTVTVILQNAETIRLTAPDGKAISVVHLSPGDKVLAACEEGARHFGMKIEETLTEK